MSAFTSCDWCSGPANWCLDRSGAVWQRCKDEGCMMHTQTELFLEEPDWGSQGMETPEGGGAAG